MPSAIPESSAPAEEAGPSPAVGAPPALCDRGTGGGLSGTPDADCGSWSLERMQGVQGEVLLGDCREWLRRLPSQAAQLVYFDPPFATQRTQRLASRQGRAYSFSDRFVSKQAYVQFLVEVLSECRRILRPEGSVFLHCDSRSNFLARQALEQVFSPEQFRSEIVWTYRRWSNGKRGLLPAHQTLLYYSRSDDYVFHPEYVPYSPATNVEQILQRRKRSQGKPRYERNSDGSATLGAAKRGVPLSDVWDMPYLNPKAKERVGYPTQKPLSLLEQVVRMASDPGGLVLDPCCGSGTSLVAARRLGRRALGVDVSKDAVELTRRRLERPMHSHSRVLVEGRAAFDNAVAEVQDKLLGLPCIAVQRHPAIDALLAAELSEEPVPIRVQREGESLREAAGKIHAAAQKRGCKECIVVSDEVLGECIPSERIAGEQEASGGEGEPVEEGARTSLVVDLPPGVRVLSTLRAQWARCRGGTGL